MKTQTENVKFKSNSKYYIVFKPEGQKQVFSYDCF